MAVISQEQWLLELYDFNPWWQSGKVPENKLFSFRRAQYESCRHMFQHSLRRILVLSGQRRVGKTTIVYQIIDDLLKSGKDPGNILFFTFDTATMRDVGIETIVHWYRSNLSESEEFYLFIDEIQKYKNWAEYIKLLYDRYPGMRCIVTGSASSRIEGSISESGSGRWYIQRIPTFSFYEFCMLSGVQKSVENIPVFRMHEQSLVAQRKIFLQLSDLNILMMRYLQQGGFPEFIGEKDLPVIRTLLADQILNRAVRQDIPSVHHIRNTDDLERIFLYLCVHSSEVISIESICQELQGVTYATVREYIRYFEEANLIYRSEQLNVQGKKMLKAKSKIYLSDCGIRWAVIPGVDIYTKENELGFAAETMLYKHVRDYYDALQEPYRVGFLQDSRGLEIDVAVQNFAQDKPLQYLEAKMRVQSAIRDKDAIVAYGLQNRPGYIMTKDHDDFGLSVRGTTSLYRFPAAAFLYLMGQQLDRLYRTEKEKAFIY